MSGVATLKIRGTKRHFDEMAVDFPVQPQACSPARLRPPPLKRGRCTPSATAANPSRYAFRPPPHPLLSDVSDSSATAAASASDAAAAASQGAHGAPTSSTQAPSQAAAAAAASAAPPTSSPSEAEPSDEPRSPPPAPVRPLTTAELSCLARFVPRRLKRILERVAAGLSAPTDRVFSAADMRDAVAAAVEDRDAKLSAQFSAVLQERLAEQFRDFTKFNEDYVTRQLRGRETTYLS